MAKLFIVELTVNNLKKNKFYNLKIQYNKFILQKSKYKNKKVKLS